MPTLLLCGHGYLGHAVARDFLAAGWEVVALSRSGDDGSLACDLSSNADVAALRVKPDFIVHCASSGRGGPDAYRAVYFNGCRHLLDRFPGMPLLFTSSTSVYAQTDGSEVTEESPAEPDRETGQILRQTEDLVLANGGLITRLSGIYGPGRSVILKKFLAGEAVIEEDGRRFLNQIHRDDAAAAILHLAGLPAAQVRLFNVSDSRPLAQLECYRQLGVMFSRPLPPAGPRDPNRKRGWTHKRVSNARLRATGWEPRFPSFLDAAAQIAPTLEGA
ncbi:NAD-dependent epimerase/dehydratase family protein [Luteolibacter marinus]|uniref:NAD-dependent epimerase/dehydratase family protein n=1 Tax=Luteolibacter marinus TaxID=2776705 RepID=UPI00186895A1|nr:NAD-dependent epimerase/dehydratase family protein [Luteolibacter marinus]